MNRHNNVCMDCHTSSRSWIKCPKCQKLMICIGSRWRVPKKGDKRNWKILCDRYSFLRPKQIVEIRSCYPDRLLFPKSQLRKEK